MFYLIVAKSIEQEDHTVVEYLMEGGRGPVKLANAVPHDLGDPGMLTFLFFFFYLFFVSVHHPSIRTDENDSKLVLFLGKFAFIPIDVGLFFYCILC